ncbi:transporter substrate-binding domain-containing protein [Glaciimonas sp. PCH181]|uniref:transporter substrate-binding domain-containing protein n=1 Tax=Glaciimonas sp. PCH181 TaxID=2133943 RepID=UPI000D3DB897|nr:transporter substrate-binding domain-containing protein [Glaciimonas sp. PCH181]PUA18884.1 amino acid ABC transporter [Glaciimonas sp. PCH181]
MQFAKLSSAILIAVATLCAHVAHADTLDDIQKAKKIRIGIGMDVPPYGMKDDQLKAIGSDVETAQLIAQNMGVALEIVPATAANRIPYLQTNKVDVVIASLAVTPERGKVIDFSLPYAAIQAVVAAPKSMVIKNYADLAGKKVVVTRASTNDAEITKYAKDAQIVRFDDDSTSITAILSGQADIFVSSPALMTVINQKNPQKNLESKIVIKTFQLSVGLRKNDDRLKQLINGYIKINLKNGKLNQIYQKYQGMPLPEEIIKAAD